MSLINFGVHAVWAVKYRRRMLEPRMRTTLIDSIHGMLVEHGHVPVETNYEPDHVHSLFWFSGRQDIAKLMQAVKGGSSNVLNDDYFDKASPFRWQGGYAAFAVCPNHMSSKAQYVRDQALIHAERDFFREYHTLLAERPPELVDEEEHTFYFEPFLDA